MTITSQDKRVGGDHLVALFVGAALVILTLLAYSRSFTYPFVNYDDPAYVFQNQQVQSGLTADSVRWAFTTFDCGNWHPLAWLSLQLDYELHGGLRSGGFHLTNVLLHTANTLLLFLVLRRLTKSVWRSAVVAALFAVHPLHVESVAWISERKDVLSTLFWMLTLAGYVYYVRRPSVRRYLLVVLPLVLGLLAKPMLVTLPCVLLLLDYWPLGRLKSEIRNPKSEVRTTQPRGTGWFRISVFGLRILEKLPLFALVLAVCIVTFLAQHRGKAVAPFEAFPLAVRIGNALLAYVGYLGKMLWPMHLAAYYPHPGSEVSVAQALGAGMLLVVLTGLALGPGRRWPYLAVGWLWYLGTLVPVIGLVQVGGQAMADRYTYVPLIGVFLLLTWGACDLATAWHLPRQYLIAAAAAVLSVCFVLTWMQVGTWRSTLELWKHAVTVTEKNVLAHMNLGTCYHERGMLSDAKKEFERAAMIDRKLAEPHVNLGNVLADLDQPERALAEYRKAIELDPERAVPHFNFGSVLARLGMWEEALAEFHKAIEIDPDNAAPHINLGNLLRDLGRLEEALAEYLRAAALDPKDAQAHNNRGIVLAELGQSDEAITEFHRAIDIEPKNAVPHTNVGNLLRDLGRLEAAQTEYEYALEHGDEQARFLLETCHRLRALHLRLPGLIAGQDQPGDNAERLAFAALCRQPSERRYALAARLCTEAFNGDPKLANDLRSANRFHGAGAAALAGCGQGEDAGGLDEEEKARLRRQALDWLQADLAVASKLAQSDVHLARVAVQRGLRMWKRDANLKGVRDPAALAMLPQAERQGWQKLWQDVETALALASTPPKKP